MQWVIATFNSVDSSRFLGDNCDLRRGCVTEYLRVFSGPGSWADVPVAVPISEETLLVLCAPACRRERRGRRTAARSIRGSGRPTPSGRLPQALPGHRVVL